VPVFVFGCFGTRIRRRRRRRRRSCGGDWEKNKEDVFFQSFSVGIFL
jgi:hypothetical protein